MTTGNALITAHRARNYLWCEGDSYMAGAFGVVLSDMLNATCARGVTVTAVGGSDMPTIASRVIANPTLAAQCRAVIWDGSANGVVADGNGSFTASVNSYLASIDSILAVTGTNIVFLPPVAVGPSSGFTQTDLNYVQAMLSIRDSLVSRGVGTLDPIDTLGPLNNGTAGDLADVAAHVVPSSLLVSTPHLNSTAMTAMANAIQSLLVSKGWMDA